MKHFGLVLVFVSLFFISRSQTGTKEAILGCWQPQSVKCDDPAASAAESNEELRSQQFCFETDGRFKVRYKQGSKMLTRVSGTYTISKDGKKITMTADASEDRNESWGDEVQIGEIVLLIGDILNMSTEGCTLNFKKVAK
jgi:hypothetical protein